LWTGALVSGFIKLIGIIQNPLEQKIAEVSYRVYPAVPLEVETQKELESV